MNKNIGEFLYFKKLSSTNDKAKELASSGASHGTTVVADEQTAGRGRNGRSFFSPSGTGLYMSIIVRPNLPVSHSAAVTVAAAVASHKAILRRTGICAEIKWVNDLLINKKKVCGILAEGCGLRTEASGTPYFDCIVIGIGINISADTVFPGDLAEKAGTLGINAKSREKLKLFRNELAVEITKNVLYEISCMENNRAHEKDPFDFEFIQYYDANSAVAGEKILLTNPSDSGKPPRVLKAGGIDGFGRLITVNENGEQELISSEEISIKF